MRLALVALAMAIAGPAAADVHKCVVSGQTTYQSGPCAGAADTVIATPKTGAERADANGHLPVTEAVARECYNAYRVLSADPTDAKMISYVGSLAPNGWPVLHVNAVFRNRAGGPDRQLLWCKLTPDMQIDHEATDASIDRWFRMNR